jgi:hypothetical protein
VSESRPLPQDARCADAISIRNAGSNPCRSVGVFLRFLSACGARASSASAKLQPAASNKHPTSRLPLTCPGWGLSSGWHLLDSSARGERLGRGEHAGRHHEPDGGARALAVGGEELLGIREKLVDALQCWTRDAGIGVAAGCAG